MEDGRGRNRQGAFRRTLWGINVQYMSGVPLIFVQ